MAKRTHEDAELTKQAILDSAFRLFSRRGYESTSLSDIARFAGVTRGALYWHFKDKGQILVELCEKVNLDRMKSDALAEAADPREEDPLSKIVLWLKECGDDSIIGISGCGPACISMALYYLTGDESLTPDRIANYSMKNGYYVSGVGTAWALLEDVPALYGIHVTQQKIREYNLRDALDEGSIIICSMSAGDFTASGHFIVIYGYDEEGYLINDPNCVARSREHWSWDRLEKQIKNIWIYSSGQTKVMDYDSLR